MSLPPSLTSLPADICWILCSVFLVHITWLLKAYYLKRLSRALPTALAWDHVSWRTSTRIARISKRKLLGNMCHFASRLYSVCKHNMRFISNIRTVLIPVVPNFELTRNTRKAEEVPNWFSWTECSSYPNNIRRILKRFSIYSVVRRCQTTARTGAIVWTCFTRDDWTRSMSLMDLTTSKLLVPDQKC